MQYKHKEAFCLMWYRCQSCGHNERFWNSRDGVTPFSMNCPSCGKLDLCHDGFFLDQCEPDYKPHPGQRVWVSMTRERAEEFAVAAVKRAKRRGVPESEDDVMQSVFESIWHNGTAPDLVVWGYTENKEES